MSEKISAGSKLAAELVADQYNLMNANHTGRDSRMDDDSIVTFAEALEDMKARVYEAEYPALKARLFFNVDSGVDTGAEFFSFERGDARGKAKIISNHADDLPSVSVEGSKENYPIVSLGTSFQWSIQDIRRAAFMGKPLADRLSRAAQRAYEDLFDELAAFGDADSRITSGLLNDPNVSVEALAGAGVWSSKTPTEILADLNALTAAVYNGSKELHMADTVLLPTAQYKRIAQTRLSVDNAETVLEAFRRANPEVQRVDSWRKLTGAGAGSTDRALAFSSRPDTHEINEPQPFEILPPQSRNLAFVVPCHGRSGGGAVLLPLAWKYMDGI